MIVSRFVKIQLLVFAVISVVGIAYVGANYVGLPRLFGGGYTVVAKFADSGGIFPNAEVTYRGVTVGRVEELRLTDGGVAVAMNLQGGTQVPASAAARVRNRSAVGEQYVDLRPQGRGGPYLHEGSIIPRGRTELPVQVSTVLRDLDRLVSSVPQEELTTTVDELGAAFEGSGPELQRLIDSGNALIEEADANLAETERLINDGETVLQTQRETSSAIKSFSSDLASISEQLRESDTDLRATLDEGTGASTQLTGLFNDVQPTLPLLLSNLIATGEVTKMRLPALEQILVIYPINVSAAFTVAPGDGTAHFGLAGNVNEPPPCTEGYEATERTYPQNTGPKKAPENVYCKEDDDHSIDVRGTRHGPRSAGRAGSENSSSSSAAGSGNSSAAGAGSGGNTSGTSGTSGGAGQSPGEASGSQGVFVAGYDPVTGRMTGPDGESYYMGSTGGQQQLLGEESWKWLLLGPLGR